MDYKDTINLPKTSFPMKAGLKDKEPKMLKEWDANNLYKQIRDARKGKPMYILHDGPPYANGDLHMGHALNKILKDIIVRYKSMLGFDTPYIPGWDCHGLPIEHKVMLELGEAKDTTPRNILRKKCRAYAQKYVDKQKKQFKRLGGIGDWDNPYLTMSKEYEAETVNIFSELVEKNYIYKGLRTIHWCPDCATALAEAEVEYASHTSDSVYVKFPVLNKINDKLDKNVNVMIWTTTPWTLPANVACAFNESLEYAAVEIGSEYFIMAKPLIETTLAKTGVDHTKACVIDITLDDIRALEIAHPFIPGRKSSVVFAMYVASDTGTGVVHTAPGHGNEDYQTGVKYALEIYCPVDKHARYTKDFPEMEGVKVWDANPKIIELLKEKGVLYHTEKIEHSYPHCWRCKSPLIFRATEQWFMKIDHDDLRKKTLEKLSELTWYPKWGKERMANMIENRPDWCLSRQRAWGVPIPAFYCKKCGETILTHETTRNVADIVKEKGVDIWFELSPKELLPSSFKCSCGASVEDFEKENDILDVWFDAGVSSFAVQKTHPELTFPADIYIEGNDQYRGWFQAAIWPYMALKGMPPYKTLVTCGWMLDEVGRPMHKSLGNVMSPDEITEKYGADILRLWVTSEDFKEDLRIGENMLQSVSDAYRKIRNTFRYILGNIDGFSPNDDMIVNMDELLLIDRYALSRLNTFLKVSKEKLDIFEYHIFYQKLINYCSVELSSTYLDILKDRLYCDGVKSVSRRSAQTALYTILEALVRIIAPVMPFTAEEIWKSYKGQDANSVHIEEFILANENDIDKGLEDKWAAILKVRDDVLRSLERARDKNAIGKSLEAFVYVCPKDENVKKVLLEYQKELRDIFIVSKVVIVDKNDENFIEGDYCSVKTERAEGVKCVRCWGHYEDVGADKEHPELCVRCAEAVK